MKSYYKRLLLWIGIKALIQENAWKEFGVFKSE
jgi:hypothetical protein